jgi:hypothetical protein
MSPPEIWGPAIWTLFHTLAERVSDHAYPVIARQLFSQIVRICKVLPCPECSIDASIFLAKVNIMELKNKTEFKNLFYLFHNYVNAKKRKPLFNYGNMNTYDRYPLIPVLNNFFAKFNTKGNMKLLNESFQRNLIQKDFKKWIVANIGAFVPPPAIIVQVEPPVIEPVIEPQVIEPVIEPQVIEPVIEPQVEEQVVIEEPQVIEPQVIELVIESVTEPQANKKSKKQKKN